MTRQQFGWGLCLMLAALVPSVVRADVNSDFETAKTAYIAGDVTRAMSVLRKGANAGHAPSQVFLGEILDASEFDEEAAAMYRKAAEQGSADGQFRLGALYAVGEGVKKDPVEAMRLIRLAADQKHVQATNMMAHVYINSQLGIPESERNGAEALRWVRAAEQNDYLPALDALLLAYRNGGLGLAPDAKEAESLQARINKLRNIQEETGKKRRRKP
ncbi:MAG TPA: tetratricopeptide repeat protein [Azospira sp.]|nr:tetratricopeptide repeat protein [Azospira sp.]